MDPKMLAAFAKKKGAQPTIPASHVDEEADDKGPVENDDAVEGNDESDAELVTRVGGLAQDGTADPAITALMQNFDSTEGCPEWAPNQDTWNHAVELVDPDGDGDQTWDDPWLVVALVYKELGGEVDSDETVEQGGKPHAEPDGDEDDGATDGVGEGGDHEG